MLGMNLKPLKNSRLGIPFRWVLTDIFEANRLFEYVNPAFLAILLRMRCVQILSILSWSHLEREHAVITSVSGSIWLLASSPLTALHITCYIFTYYILHIYTCAVHTFHTICYNRRFINIKHFIAKICPSKRHEIGAAFITSIHCFTLHLTVSEWRVTRRIPNLMKFKLDWIWW